MTNHLAPAPFKPRGRNNDHDILSRTLGEEKEADKTLNRIAKEIVNPKR